MIHIAMPLGASHGWGIAGKSIAKELSALTPIRLITDPFDANQIGDLLEYQLLASLLPPGTTPQTGFNATLRTAGPVLQCAAGVEHHLYRPGLRGTVNVGYTFFEDNLLVRQYVQNIRDNFDIIVGGATWTRDVLVEAGIPDARVVIQGIDPRLFNPHLNEKEFFRDRFVVFSGGKLELRKGQDLVIRAYQVLQQRHKDVMLVNQWFNPWPPSLQTMAASKLIHFEPKTNDYFLFLNQLFGEHGIDLSRVLSLGPLPNIAVSRIYKNTDIGLFPNRCEGGTNLVMNEYMACGKPVVASFNTGHKDVLSEQNSVRIMTNRPFTYLRDGQPVATWEEPDLDETIERLEWAYQHRDQLNRIGQTAAADQQNRTWRHTAEGFLKILQERPK
jgi:glycosyltransferase involved in cell wall biosynthesis